MPTRGSAGPPRLRAGDVVEVRAPHEILATLDERGELDSLPFMPEMLRYCGRRFTVAKVAHKTCDTITGTGYRRMDDAVHLAGVRCDGSAHDGCQAAWLTYWKAAWLRAESRGAHYRLDTPQPDPAWRGRILWRRNAPPQFEEVHA